MAEVGAWNNNVWVWKFGWRRNLFEWEKNLECLLSQEVHGVSLNLEKEDRWEWKEGEEVGYSVKTRYLRLGGASRGEREGVYKVLEV